MIKKNWTTKISVITMVEYTNLYSIFIYIKGGLHDSNYI